MVGILADRAPAGQKMLAVPFLGDPAPLPTGPLSLCAALGAPVVLFFGVRTGARQYEIHFELFADRIVRATLTPHRGHGGLGHSLCGTA